MCIVLSLCNQTALNLGIRQVQWSPYLLPQNLSSFSCTFTHMPTSWHKYANQAPSRCSWEQDLPEYSADWKNKHRRSRWSFASCAIVALRKRQKCSIRAGVLHNISPFLYDVQRAKVNMNAGHANECIHKLECICVTIQLLWYSDPNKKFIAHYYLMNLYPCLLLTHTRLWAI